MNHVSRLIVLFLFLSHNTKGQKPMDFLTLPTAGSAAVAVSEAADPLAWHRDMEDTGREDDEQGRFSANQTNEDPPTSRRDEGMLGSSPQSAPQGESDGPSGPGEVSHQMMRDGGAAESQRHSKAPDHGWYAPGANPMMTDEQVERLMKVVELGVDPEVAWKRIN